MITGAHIIIYSTNPEADRAFFRDVLEFPHVDVGGGWLIFALPPSEVAVHPSDANGRHEFYLMCESLEETSRRLRDAGVEVTSAVDEGWGLLAEIGLPSGSRIAVYEPRHPVAYSLE